MAALPARRALLPRRLKIAAAVAAPCAVAAIALSVFAGGGDGDAGTAQATAAATPAPAPAPAAEEQLGRPLKSHPKVVRAVPPGEAPPEDATTTTSPGGSTASEPPSDAEVRSELSEFREHLTGSGVARGNVPEVRSDGTAVAPLEAPDVVATVIAAGNEIATKPYKWGGGHGAWRDKGYDCSGSVSFALAGAGLLNAPMTSGAFMKYGDKGPGKWITIYANQGHIFMIVAGLRFDTSGAAGGTRWQQAPRSVAGFAVRHPPGL